MVERVGRVLGRAVWQVLRLRRSQSARTATLGMMNLGWMRRTSKCNSNHQYRDLSTTHRKERDASVEMTELGWVEENKQMQPQIPCGNDKKKGKSPGL
jgi:hypothetical protein